MKPDRMGWIRAALAPFGGWAVGSGLGELAWAIALREWDPEIKDPFLMMGFGLGLILAVRELRLRPRD